MLRLERKGQFYKCNNDKPSFLPVPVPVLGSGAKATWDVRQCAIVRSWPGIYLLAALLLYCAHLSLNGITISVRTAGVLAFVYFGTRCQSALYAFRIACKHNRQRQRQDRLSSSLIKMYILSGICQQPVQHR